MNIFTGIGRLTADPEIRQTAAGLTVASYTLAIDRYSKDKDKEADFIRCKCFGKTADFAANHLFKGTKIGVVGTVRTGSYTNNDGKTVYTTDIIVNEHTFCEKSQGGGQYQTTAQPQTYQTQPLPEALNDFEEVLSDGDLPF